MNWSRARSIFYREFLSQMRDRRMVLLYTIVPVFLYPIMGLMVFQMGNFIRRSAITVQVVGAENLPQDPPLIQDGKFIPEFLGDPEEAYLVTLQIVEPTEEEPEAPKPFMEHWKAIPIPTEVNARLVFPPRMAENMNEAREQVWEDYRNQPEAEKPVRTPIFEESLIPDPQPTIQYRSSEDISQTARQRLTDILERWTSVYTRRKLQDEGVPYKAAAPPFRLAIFDQVEPGSQRSGLWAKIFPFLMIVWGLTGAFQPAVDLVPGEKERGTLETLLCSPASRREIVWGKLLTIFAFSIFTVLVNLISMGLTGALILALLPQLDIPSPWIALWLALSIGPVCALFSALCLGIATFARSTAEGHFYMMPLFVLLLPLVAVPLLPTYQLDWTQSFVPIAGLVLVLRYLIEGQIEVALQYLGPVLLVTGIATWLAIRWAIRQFDREDILFREAEQVDPIYLVKRWWNNLRGDRSPQSTESS
ncbi:CPBP family intramembrane metalloprotease domain-containing protein [Planctomycetales bacterium 10988]|nr:CPBP family intramembrane metalloprotease domain-containing protein [Planctomycetales bacterium 10988]